METNLTAAQRFAYSYVRGQSRNPKVSQAKIAYAVRQFISREKIYGAIPEAVSVREALVGMLRTVPADIAADLETL